MLAALSLLYFCGAILSSEYFSTLTFFNSDLHKHGCSSPAEWEEYAADCGELLSRPDLNVYLIHTLPLAVTRDPSCRTQDHTGEARITHAEALGSQQKFTSCMQEP